MIGLALVAGALAGEAAVRLGDARVVADAASGVVLGSVGEDLAAIEAATGKVRWRREGIAPLYQEGRALLVYDEGPDLRFSVVDAATGTTTAACGWQLPSVPFGLPVGWRRVFEQVTVERSQGPLVQVRWTEAAEEVHPRPVPRGWAGAALVPATGGGVTLDLRDCHAASWPREGRSDADPADPHVAVRPAPDITDAAGRQLPAWRWVRLDDSGAEVESRTLDAGFRTRVVDSADGATFATAYALPETPGTIAWTVYRHADGERLGRIAPKADTDAFVVVGTTAIFARGGAIVGYPLDGGKEWVAR